MSMGQGLRALLKEGGTRALFRGNAVSCVKIAPQSAATFLAYDMFKRLFSDDPATITGAARFAAGASAGIVAQVLVYPLEVVKIRLQMLNAPAGTIRSVLGTVVRTEGYKALYRGLSLSIVGTIPYSGTDLAVYETIKTYFMRHRPSEEPTLPVLLGAGACSSVAAQLASYPFGMVRTRMQAATGETEHYRSGTDAFRKIVQQEGYAALYKGMLPNMLRAVPSVCLSYVTYEATKSFLKKNGL
eukprot:TRINITY_DN11533_c0_g2_i1.p1 TRINITY_DN11533_c0_g2~~TRINITY_DN11533_c0_g2_i1.p1  ORF type:complete len:285 (-),score=71.92 TRINITY_DN11533_c0_g2_i1:912-1640(-)